MLIPEVDSWQSLIDSVHLFSDDFMAEREQPVEPKRIAPAYMNKPIKRKATGSRRSTKVRDQNVELGTSMRRMEARIQELMLTGGLWLPLVEEPLDREEIKRGDYWQRHFESLLDSLLLVVRGYWANDLAISTDLNVKLVPYFAGKHCLEAIALARLANEAGSYAVALTLLRQAVEALSVVALAISDYEPKLDLLKKWDEEKLSAGELRKELEKHVWPSIPALGLWDESWTEFWAKFVQAVQPYTHFTSRLLQWHYQIVSGNEKHALLVTNSTQSFDPARALRVSTFQLLILWAFAELVNAYGAAPDWLLAPLVDLMRLSKKKLEASEAFFNRAEWDVQFFSIMIFKDEHLPEVFIDDLLNRLSQPGRS